MAERRTLLLDIETSPHEVWVWDFYNVHVAAPEQVIRQGKIICFAAKWLGEKEVFFEAGDYHPLGSDEFMMNRLYELLDEADVVVHFNGLSFDIPWINTEFVQRGMTPPSPSRHLDLLLTIRKRFRFPSNKLAYISEQLSLEGKIKHYGFDLWIDVIKGDMKAWKLFEKYNRRDVTLLEDLRLELLPWLIGAPAYGADNGDFVCPNCGSADLTKQGIARTKQTAYQQYRCGSCGSWSRDTRTLIQDGKRVRSQVVEVTT